MSFGSGSPVEQVARLEHLLDRVRKNAALPRVARSVAPAVSTSFDASQAPLPVGEVSYEADDFAEIEVVEIDGDGSMPPPVAADSVSPTSGPELQFGDVRSAPPAAIEVPRPQRAGAYSVSFPPSSRGEAVFGDEAPIGLQARRDSDRPTAAPAGDQPTMEQLGATISMDDAAGPSPDLELDVESLPPSQLSELEVALPGRAFAGGFDDQLAPPPGAHEDLASYQRHSAAQAAELAPASAPAASMSPQVVGRGAPDVTVPVAEIVDDRKPSQGGFLALLDDSVSLNRK